jgi:hypothetical protein
MQNLNLHYEKYKSCSLRNINIYIQYMYINHMQITWDPNKAEINLKKHKIRFSDAEMVLYDPLAMTLEEHDIENE